jgi:hypothetical protein
MIVLYLDFFAEARNRGRQRLDVHGPPSQGMKKTKQLTPSRKGTKHRKEKTLAFLCDLCVLCAFA